MKPSAAVIRERSTVSTYTPDARRTCKGNASTMI
jgi:hypothetical protein